MPRELLKFRKGDVGLKIQKDGKLEVAGVTPDMPMIDSKGNVNPALLFAAAWARKDQKVFEVLVQNFKDSVKEGIFGEDAQKEYKTAIKIQKENVPPFLNPDTSLGNEFETHSDKPTSGAVTFEQPEPGVTTWPGEKGPMTVEDQLSRRDS
jgi:hypothetical protein